MKDRRHFDLDVVPWLQLGAAIAIFASVLTAHGGTPATGAL